MSKKTANSMQLGKVSLIFQVVCISLIKAQYTEVNKVCKASRPGQCYTLYKSMAGPLTWTQAQQACISYNMTLATVPDVDTQRSLEQLIETRSNTEAWTAGQVSKISVSWQSIGRRIYKHVSLPPDVSDNNCGYLNISAARISSASCTDLHIPLCHSLSGGSCGDNEIHIGQVCLRRLSHKVTWYSAVMACTNRSLQLMSYEPKLLNLSASLFDGSNMWLDVHRYTWEWNAGKGDPETMTYFNWYPTSGKNLPNHCMYIAEADGTKWRSKLCNWTSENLQYFICENKTTTLAREVRPVGPVPSKTGIESKYIIILAVLFGVALFVGIGVLVLWYFSKKREFKRRGSNSPGGVPERPPPPGSGVPGRTSNDYQPSGVVKHNMGNKGTAYVYFNDLNELDADVASGGAGIGVRREALFENATGSRAAAACVRRAGGRETSDAYTNKENEENERKARSHPDDDVRCVYAKVNKAKKTQTEPRA